jgi:hypothetical protein
MIAGQLELDRYSREVNALESGQRIMIELRLGMKPEFRATLKSARTGETYEAIVNTHGMLHWRITHDPHIDLSGMPVYTGTDRLTADSYHSGGCLYVEWHSFAVNMSGDLETRAASFYRACNRFLHETELRHVLINRDECPMLSARWLKSARDLDVRFSAFGSAAELESVICGYGA